MRAFERNLGGDPSGTHLDLELVPHCHSTLWLQTTKSGSTQHPSPCQPATTRPPITSVESDELNTQSMQRSHVHASKATTLFALTRLTPCAKLQTVCLSLATVATAVGVSVQTLLLANRQIRSIHT